MSAKAAMHISRRRACEADVPFLRDLRAQTMEQHHLAAGIPQSYAENEAKVRAHFECAEILELDGQCIGLLKILREPTEWRVVQVQLLPEYQGSGIGGRLLGALVAQARDAGVSIALSVLKGNPARHLYERLGFEITSEGERVFHMQAAA